MTCARLAGAAVAGRTRATGYLAGAVLFAALAASCSGGAGGLDRTGARSAPREATRPNIVWIVADAVEGDSGTESLGGARTMLVESAAVASDPASARAALLTGVGPGALRIDATGSRLAVPPPAGLTVLPERLRRAGYYTSRAGPPRHNLAAGHAGPVEVVHVDSGVHAAARAGPVPVEDLAQPGLLGSWDAAGPGADWRGREKDWESPCTVSFGCGGARSPGAPPFFALFNVDAGAGPGEVLEERVAHVVETLAADNLLDDTVVFLIGAGGPAPSVAVRWPEGLAAVVEAGVAVSLLDLAPTALELAGLPIPAHMEGRPLVGANRPAPASTPAPSAAKGEADADPGTAASTPGTPPVAANPRGYPTGGLFHVAPRVELRCDTEGSTIVYTTEREAPFYWRLYTGPFRMRFWALRFQCGRLGYRDSDIVRYDFDIE